MIGAKENSEMSELSNANPFPPTIITVTDTLPVSVPSTPDFEVPGLSLSDKFFCCPKCCLYFEAAKHSMFKNHLVECLVRKKHPCVDCGRIFVNQTVLDYHIEHSHRNPNPLNRLHRVKPNGISKKDSEEKILNAEAEDRWPKDESEAQKIAGKTGKWKCWICSYSSKKKNLFQKHLKRIHRDTFGNVMLKCEHCEFSFVQKHHLREHLNEVHPDETEYTCKGCDRKFQQKNRNHDCKKIECEVCNESFNRLGERTKHMSSAHPEHKTFKCTQCSKEFIKIQYLTIHMRVHEDSRPYPCEFCEKRFRSKSHYNNHKRLHTGEKPYKCQICEDSFPSPQCLHSHLAMHSGKKDFKCSECDAVFRIKGDLTRHESIHSGLRLFACRTCGKTFNRRSNCTVHEKSHLASEKKEFRCENCGKEFDRLKKLNVSVRRHIKDIHNKPLSNDEESSVTGVKKPEICSPADSDNDSQSQLVKSFPVAQYMDVDDVASNVEVVGDGEETETGLSNEMEIRPLGVWQQTEFGFLNEDGTHVMPMYVAVLPCTGSAVTRELETVAKVEVIDSETTSLQIEFDGETPAKGYLQIVSTDS